LIVSSEYFERICGKEGVDASARRQMRTVLKKKKKEAHPYDKWVHLWEVENA
jgi:hypothetical protein